MRNKILNELNNPGQLEKLYRDNKLIFKRAFNAIYSEIKDKELAQFWFERLNFQSDKMSWGATKQLITMILAALLAGFIAEIPHLTGIKAFDFYPRNVGFIFIPILTAYFCWKHEVKAKSVIFIILAGIGSCIFINWLPGSSKEPTDTFVLSCLHLPLLLWALCGFAYSEGHLFRENRTLQFLRFNGELVVLTILILISGAILTLISVQLFSLIDIDLSKFSFENIVIFGVSTSPVVATYLIETNPEMVSRVSPVIAKIFSPLVLITLVLYLAAMTFTGKSPSLDRDFLLIFNFVLIGVMAIIVFALSSHTDQSFVFVTLFLLTLVTIVVNCIALSAIAFRISTWGITPNRLAVLGSNVLILINLLFVCLGLFQSIRNKEKVWLVEKSIAVFLPIYALWAAFIVFVLPLLFHFK